MLRVPLRSLSARITVGVVATVLVIGCGSFWLLQTFYRRQMIESLADSTTVHGKLVEQSLRYAMHTRSLDLLAEMVRSLGDQKGVEKVMILDKKGVIRYSSNQAEHGRVLSPTDPTCMICHQTDAAVRGRTVIFATGGGRRVFRNVNPILNSDSCFGCHPSRDRVNGVLIVDYSMAGIQASLDNGARKMWVSALALALGITVVIIGLMRWLVLNRLRTLVQMVDSIEAGHLDGLAQVRGADEITQLSQHLNGMASTLDQSLRDLRDREAFLDAVINSADDGIVVVDELMRVVTANRAFAQMLGAAPGGVAGQPCQCVASCLTVDANRCPARTTFDTGEVTHRVRSVTAADGAEHTYEISCSPIHLDGATRQVIEVWRDITRRREIEAQLANSDRLASLGLLAAGVSHEINNPLASITTCLDGLGRRMRQHEGGPPAAELAEYLDLIRGEVARCCELTERLKVLGHRPRPTPQAVDIGAAIRDTLALVRYLAENRGVAIELDAAAGVPPVHADEQQVRQVVLNLVLNAIQAVEGPGWVRVSTRAGDPGTAVIEVADSGVGIAPRELTQIFEPFYSSRPDGRGTGLGLFITKIIVEQFGGSIAVASTPGQGTRFTVVLPTAPSAATKGQE
jgi:PAS domain S-box-containing protein